MELNNELIDLIKKWIKTDNEMRTLKQEVANRKKTKDKLSSELLTIMKSKDIDSFNINSGKIEYVQRKTKKPISKKLLQTILSKYYKGDTNKANELNDFILDNREETSKDLLIHKI
jgi:CxxC motif-containing protein